MIIGVPREIKTDEFRVSMTPAGVEMLVARKHTVLVEAGAGAPSGHSDADYMVAGATMTTSARDVYAGAELIVKVKEPLAGEVAMLREGQVLFTYLHLASSRELTEGLIRSRCVALAYETIEMEDGRLPLLIPMSEVAGRMSVQQGAKYLEREHGGRGVLLSGVPGVEPGTVLILGAGTVGSNAAWVAAGLGARVHLMDTNLAVLRHLSEVMPPNVTTLMASPANTRKMLPSADVVICSVLVHGAKAPKVITRDMLGLMKKGSVIVDVAIDQGGGVETSRPTTHKNPIYEVDGIIHYCVTNMPGAMPATATAALTNATIPYVLTLADDGYRSAIGRRRDIARGANVVLGHVTYPNVAAAFGLECKTPQEALA